MTGLAVLGLLVAGSAAATPVHATYEVHAAGLRIMEVEAVIDLDAPRAPAGTARAAAAPPTYALELRTRLRGLVTALGSGAQVTRAAGVWRDGDARPASYVSEGTWRGQPQRVVIDYPAGQPVLRQLLPAEAEDREPVPEEARRGTLDSLSVLAQLMRAVGATNRCEGRASVFDGRRRVDFTAVTEGVQALPASGDAWAGEALRCRFEGRVVAGFRHDQGPEDRRPQEGTAWLAAPRPGMPPIPVRIEVATRWFGALTGTLVRVSSPGVAASAAGTPR